MQWHPDVTTQLVVASDEDSSPALRVMTLQIVFFSINVCRKFLIYKAVCKQLWDMRNTLTPVKEFVGHTKGMAHYDTSFLIFRYYMLLVSVF